MTDQEGFTFAISLSALDHLGRNLYRSFTTVIGEAISNSWDADADNVWIYLDDQEGDLFIKDDGDGMTAEDFQRKFLKIGYSKRQEGRNKSEKGRPYIGRKGIGKLALLTYSESITVITKKEGGSYVGGRIDNSGLDEAIKRDLEPDEYKLGKFDLAEFGPYTEGHEKGTIIHFEKPKEKIRHTLPFLKKNLALYFRFSLLDGRFKIFFNGEQVSVDDLSDLSGNTQFIWKINDFRDSLLGPEHFPNLLMPIKEVRADEKIRGFIASVSKPKDLNIFGTGERVGIDFFVNGRVRDRNILVHMPSARLVDNYLYGQVHFDSMDDEVDRFTTSREGIKPYDDEYAWALGEVGKLLSKVRDDWDDWRYEHNLDGDAESERISRVNKSRRSLFKAVSDEYATSKQRDASNIVNQWINQFSEDAEYNLSSYAECFVSENLVRKHIVHKKIELTPESKETSKKLRRKKRDSKKKGNVSIPLRKRPHYLGYLGMDRLAYEADRKVAGREVSSLIRDSKTYKPIRDALMHTALLTDEAKTQLDATYKNIRSRVTDILNGDDDDTESEER